MTYPDALILLQEKIEEMREPNSKITYAAVVQDEIDEDFYKLEYGTNDGIYSDFHIEGVISEEEKMQFQKNLRLEYDPNKNQVKDHIGIVTSNNVGQLLSKNDKYEPIRERIRPLKAGVGISDFSSREKTGTLGAIFKGAHDKNMGNYFLSNMHVVARFNEMYTQLEPSKNQELVVQPSKSNVTNLDLQIKNDTIGITVWKVFGPEVDAAITKLHSGIVFSKGFYNRKISMYPVPTSVYKTNRSAYKIGYKTGETWGKIKSINAAVRIKNPYNKLNKLGDHIVFTNQIMTTDMAEKGDSGSILIYQNGFPIGLTFADINFTKPFKENGQITRGRTFHNKLSSVQKLAEEGKNYNGKYYPLKFKNFIN